MGLQLSQAQLYRWFYSHFPEHMTTVDRGEVDIVNMSSSFIESETNRKQHPTQYLNVFLMCKKESQDIVLFHQIYI